MPLRFIGPLRSLKSLRSLRPFKVLRVVANKVEMLINCAILSNSGGANHFAPPEFGVRRNGDLQ